LQDSREPGRGFTAGIGIAGIGIAGIGIAGIGIAVIGLNRCRGLRRRSVIAPTAAATAATCGQK
jgi:hypothetical protein